MKPAQICLSLYGSTDRICADIASSPDADLYEVRMDLSESLDCGTVRNATAKPLIFTAHDAAHTLWDARSFADYLDAGTNRAAGRKAIVSVHAEESDPDALWARLSGDHVNKIVMNTRNYAIIARLLDLNRKQDRQSLCFAQGDVGSFSRVLSVFYGAPWIYACLPDRSTGAGQFTLQQLSEIFRIKRFNRMPHIFGIVGNPVYHSKSPEFHNHRFAEYSLPWIYLPFLCENLSALLQYAPSFGIIGFSITHPFKKEIVSHLQEASPEVKELQCCNTVFFKEGRWHGTNTDIIGVRAIVERHQVPIANSRVVVLGAGASARAVVSVVRAHAKEITILNRTPSTAAELAAEFDCKSGRLEDFESCQYDVVFQTTTIGMRAGECPVDV
ncbi:MAG TPA: type I 3-dehydroquinate dehydratase, partial [Acidobacteriota bacterium]|nr:type I 3-dehydroquinate dehydratase [Acidobacteriota bacterium]